MNWLDILLVAVPFAAVMAVGFQTRRYVRGVVDFLSAGRLCGRYLLTVGDIANGISIVGVLSYLERKYKVGFAVDFWNRVLIPVTITLALTGYCIYRFRETRALSAGQFLEMRYGSRGLRFYFSFVRVLAEMLAHSIMPAVAARFFMYFLGLPEHFTCCGATFSTFVVLMVGCMACAIALICWGGLLTIVVTDTLQGLLCVPLMLLFGLFLLTQFSWGRHILPVLLDRVGGESFVNSFDVKQVRDFNIFAIIVSLTTTILHRATWLGGGASGAARTPHEQKMASLLGQWRGLLGTLLYTLLALSMMVLLNHHDFAPQARSIRTELAVRVARDIVADPPTQARVVAALEAVPEHTHHPGEGAPLSHKSNLETPYLEAASAALGDTPSGRAKSQEFSSLYKQQMVSVTLRHLFGHGLLGLFMLLMILAMVSTDDSYIFSSVLTIVQDLILPFFKRPPSPRLHIWLLRGAAIGVGAFFLVCSLSLAQLDYIELFRMSVLPMYLGGCGPVMVFGLYGRFGTKQGAWTSMLAGTGLSLVFVVCQRQWAGVLYPFLERRGWVSATGRLLDVLSRPFQPYIVWEMNPKKFPINSFESYFFIMLTTLALYVVVSKLTCKAPFNLERLLHRGKYRMDGEELKREPMNWRRVLAFFTGITPQHTFGDKVISWGLFCYSYLYSFCGTFLLVLAWNAVRKWPALWWGRYFLVVSLIVPLCLASVTAVWFWVGGILDMRRLRRDLLARTSADALDNGMVGDGGVSLADAARFGKK